jgi:DNA polymerase-1
MTTRTCGSSVALPSKFDRFREIWGWDFEFRPDSNHRPVPVTMFAKEIRSGREVRMRLADLTSASRLPFGNEPDTLVESYSAVAELSCCIATGLPIPRNVLCTYAETAVLTNGLEIDGLADRRPGLLEACDLYQIPHMTKDQKAAARDFILGKDPADYTSEEWTWVEGYNEDDTLTDIALFEAEASAIDVPAALFRGRYSKAVADMEATGIPVDVAYISELKDAWRDLRLHFIRQLDHLQLYDDAGVCHLDRMAALIEARGWFWPRTEKAGQYKMDAKTLGKMAQRYPELRSTQRLRDQIAELRLGAFLHTIGADGFSRCPLMPFWTVTGRNQPQGRDLAFLPSLPSWTHGVIKPPEGWGIAGLDWMAQEIGIGAGLSGDPALTADFLAGDPHLGFAIRSGLAPEGATRESHAEIRAMVKPISLGIPYGISKYGVAAQTGKPLHWAAGVLATWRHTYPKFMEWQQNTVTQALFDRQIISPLGFPMAVQGATRKRSLMNYMHQASGSDTMRLAAIAGREAGIRICCPIHDAFAIMAPLNELGDAIETMARIMVRASAVITGGLEIPVEKSFEVRWPDCLGDVRKPKAKGQALWIEIRDLVRGKLKQRRA